MPNRYYILDEDNNLVGTDDVLVWGEWVEKSDRKIAITYVPIPGHGDAYVSTVFLGLNHAYNDGPPVLWETMVFDLPKEGEWQERYTSREDAIKGHEEMVQRVKNAYPGTVPS